MPLSLLVSGGAAVLLGLITVRLSGHYLPLGTIAWGLSLYYVFSKIALLGRNDGISSIPPLAIGDFQLLDIGRIYYAIWIAVFVAAILTLNLLDSRTGRAIRALRRGHVAAEAFGVSTARAKLFVFIYAARAGGPVGLALRALPARGEPDAVRRRCRHRVPVHGRGRRRRPCVGRGARRGSSSRC